MESCRSSRRNSFGGPSHTGEDRKREMRTITNIGSLPRPGTPIIGQSNVSPTRRKSYPGEFSERAQRRLRGIESETKVFLSVVFVVVGGFMMIRVGTPHNPGDPFVFAHAD